MQGRLRLATASIVWFRIDLRLADQPALAAAAARGGAVLPVYVHSPDEEGEWRPGGASNWWLHNSLAALNDALRKLGSQLLIRRGPALASLLALAREVDASAVFWCRRYEPAIVARDMQLKSSLRAAGLEATSFNGNLLVEPWEIKNQSGRPFQVFTPFWKQVLRSTNVAAPSGEPASLSQPRAWPASLPLAALELLPSIRWYRQMDELWTPGESGAQRQLARFSKSALFDYGRERDLPATAGTSRLSPHLHFGEISPRQIWHRVAAAAAAQNIAAETWRSWQYIAELGWREFGHHLLHHFSRTPLEPQRNEFTQFPWRESPGDLLAWQRGRTGVPLVDAGMRELWSTGWMHNRVRMVVASYLVKNLRLPWQNGARWFWDTLVDADLASNTLGWQWSAGCGADAAPYFRVFNAVSQGKRFDAQGAYIRRWVPELAALDDSQIHAPWTAATPPADYPAPLVDLKVSREAALAAWQQMRAGSGDT